jgi:hypothetical protein
MTFKRDPTDFGWIADKLIDCSEPRTGDRDVADCRHDGCLVKSDEGRIHGLYRAWNRNRGDVETLRELHARCHRRLSGSRKALSPAATRTVGLSSA